MTATQTHPSATQIDLLAEIAGALADPTVTATAICELSERAALAEEKAMIYAADARGLALNPILAPDRVAAALEAATAQAFHAERLAAAREALDALAGPRLEEQIEAARASRRNHAIAERDRTAARLAGEYPALQSKLIELLMDAMQAHSLVDAANRDRVGGEDLIQRAEGLARGFHDKDDLSGGGAPYNFEITRLSQMIIPDFSHPDRLAWPPNLSLNQLAGIRRGQPDLSVVAACFRALQKEGKE